MKKCLKLLPVLLLSALLLSGCGSTEPLPDGMEEDPLLDAGQAVVDLLIDGDYQAVYSQFREDIRAGLTVEDVEALVAPSLAEAGTFESVEETLVSGSTETEPHAIAQFTCSFSQREVTFQTAFDPDLQLIGLAAGARETGWSFSHILDNLSNFFG